MATRHMPPREAMAVWSKATRDPVDDVRLLAYAMRDDSEKKLSGRILALTEALPDVPVLMRNGYHKTIAALCWELVYHRLAQGALRQHWLQVARRHLELVFATTAVMPLAPPPAATPTLSVLSALSAMSDTAMPAAQAMSATGDTNSWLLYGRILLDAGDFEGAREAFANAQAGGMDEQRVLPWLAEIAFKERKFLEVKRYLSALTRSGEKGRELAQVKAWWARG